MRIRKKKLKRKRNRSSKLQLQIFIAIETLNYFFLTIERNPNRKTNMKP